MNYYGCTNCEQARDYYGVPACIGRRVLVNGKKGIIAEDRGNYIGILLDEDPPLAILMYNPTDGIEYLGMGEVRRPSLKEIKKRERYNEEYFEFSEMT